MNCGFLLMASYPPRKLSHRRLAAWIATTAVTAVGSGDFHEKAVKEFVTLFGGT
jgi:hypothetical protein